MLHRQNENSQRTELPVRTAIKREQKTDWGSNTETLFPNVNIHVDLLLVVLLSTYVAIYVTVEQQLAVTPISSTNVFTPHIIIHHRRSREEH